MAMGNLKERARSRQSATIVAMQDILPSIALRAKGRAWQGIGPIREKVDNGTLEQSNQVQSLAIKAVSIKRSSYLRNGTIQTRQ